MCCCVSLLAQCEHEGMQACTPHPTAPTAHHQHALHTGGAAAAAHAAAPHLPLRPRVRHLGRQLVQLLAQLRQRLRALVKRHQIVAQLRQVRPATREEGGGTAEGEAVQRQGRQRRSRGWGRCAMSRAPEAQQRVRALCVSGLLEKDTKEAANTRGVDDRMARLQRHQQHHAMHHHAAPPPQRRRRRRRHHARPHRRRRHLCAAHLYGLASRRWRGMASNAARLCRYSR